MQTINKTWQTQGESEKALYKSIGTASTVGVKTLR